MIVPKPARESVASAPGKAQVLTSASFLQSLVEKEKIKKEAAEEKERRKIEQEEKRALKEKEKQENKGRCKAKDSLKNGQKAVQKEHQ